MTLLLIGLLLWWAGHLFKRLVPAQRAALTERMGEKAKGIFAVVLLVSVVLMVIGYRSADTVFVYVPPSWGVHLNNLLMVFAIALFGLGSSKSRLRSRMRHPMLTGMLVWAVAHLLTNGDVASLFLFGSLGVWAVFTMLIINLGDPPPPRYEGGSVAGDVRLAVISAVLYAIIATIHTWLGYWPFA